MIKLETNGGRRRCENVKGLLGTLRLNLEGDFRERKRRDVGVRRLLRLLRPGGSITAEGPDRRACKQATRGTLGGSGTLRLLRPSFINILEYGGGTANAEVTWMPDKMLHTGTLREAGRLSLRDRRGLRPPSSGSASFSCQFNPAVASLVGTR